jgi:hypothetical protein
VLDQLNTASEHIEELNVELNKIKFERDTLHQWEAGAYTRPL